MDLVPHLLICNFRCMLHRSEQPVRTREHILSIIFGHVFDCLRLAICRFESIFQRIYGSLNRHVFGNEWQNIYNTFLRRVSLLSLAGNLLSHRYKTGLGQYFTRRQYYAAKVIMCDVIYLSESRWETFSSLARNYGCDNSIGELVFDDQQNCIQGGYSRYTAYVTDDACSDIAYIHKLKNAVFRRKLR